MTLKKLQSAPNPILIFGYFLVPHVLMFFFATALLFFVDIQPVKNVFLWNIARYTVIIGCSGISLIEMSRIIFDIWNRDLQYCAGIPQITERNIQNRLFRYISLSVDGFGLYLAPFMITFISPGQKTKITYAKRSKIVLTVNPQL